MFVKHVSHLITIFYYYSVPSIPNNTVFIQREKTYDTNLQQLN